MGTSAENGGTGGTGRTGGTVARRYLEAFGGLGLTRVFGLPGVHNLAFWRDWAPGLPEIVGVRHEQTTVYAADGLARATGGLGVALVTTGPGAANAVGAFGEAAACGSPVVLVASEIPSTLARPGEVRGVLHESRDQAGLFEPLAKAVFRPRTAEAAVEALSEAIGVALAWPRGPVYLDVPTDVLSRPAPPPVPLPVSRERVRVRADTADVERLARLLADRDRVVIWAGGGVLQSGAELELARLAERLDAPVITTYAARGVLGDHPCAVGLPPHEPEVAELIAGADLMLAVGTGFDGMMTRNWRMPMPAELAVINCAAEELAKNYRPDLSVLGDARDTLAALLDRIPGREQRSAQSLRAVREAVWARLGADARTTAAVAFLRSVEAAITDDTVVVCDMAVPGYWYGGYGRAGRPRGLQYPVGWGTLGYALPASVGPAAAGHPVLTVCGDGGFLFAAGELATLAQYRMPATVLVVDDGGYGMLRYDQEVAGDPIRGVELNSPAWPALGGAFDIEVSEVDGVGTELEKALREALGSGQPRLVVTHAALSPPRTTSPRWFE
ncbi:thiamine pyrophosphate-binding protein [Actinophytocola sp.]|uniref:thiamine pyrophosphate-binding protein n=1 Tax=Actinophytocola sp. TaxID=1872138 RepID=UPI003D6AC2E7